MGRGATNTNRGVSPVQAVKEPMPGVEGLSHCCRGFWKQRQLLSNLSTQGRDVMERYLFVDTMGLVESF